MTLKEYQQQAMTTCLYESNNFSYMMLNLVGEVGEFASKVAKAIRKDKSCIYYNDLQTESGPNAMTLEEVEDLRKEAGDILWQLSGLCTVMGVGPRRRGGNESRKTCIPTGERQNRWGRG